MDTRTGYTARRIVLYLALLAVAALAAHEHQRWTVDEKLLNAAAYNATNFEANHWFPRNTHFILDVATLPAPSAGTTCIAVFNATSPTTFAGIAFDVTLTSHEALTSASSWRILTAALVFRSQFESLPTITTNPGITGPVILNNQNSVLQSQDFSSSCERDVYRWKWSSLNDPLYRREMTTSSQLLLCFRSITNDGSVAGKGWTAAGTVNWAFTYPGNAAGGVITKV